MLVSALAACYFLRNLPLTGVESQRLSINPYDVIAVLAWQKEQIKRDDIVVSQFGDAGCFFRGLGDPLLIVENL